MTLTQETPADRATGVSNGQPDHSRIPVGCKIYQKKS